MNDKGRLQFNPDPIKVVPAENRDVWFKKQGWRCDYEDARGRCSSRETTSHWNEETRVAESYCERHQP